VTPSIASSPQQVWTRKLIDNVEPGAEWVGVEYTWWYNPTNRNGLRLTSIGYKWINKHTDLKFYIVNLQNKIVGRQYLQLERLLSAPYFISKSDQIGVHSETDAVMLQLHAGDLVTYLNNLENNQ
jgi:hypothetical protein